MASISRFDLDNMVDENVPAPAPTRSDDQILPFAVWVPIRKSNYVMDLQKKQKNLIFHIVFTLDANLLREVLEITPTDQAHLFVSPPSGDAIMDFMNELGYPETSGHDRPRYPVLQMLWGIITNTNFDYAELMWEEFVQAMQTFLTDKANLGSPTKKGRKGKPHVIPYYLRLGNLKFVPKGEVDEVFGMPIPNELISNNIRNAPYYNAYLEMVAKHDQKVTTEKEGKKKTASAKQPKSKPATEKSSKPAPTTKPKVTKEKPSKPSTAKPPKPKPSKEKSTKATPLQKAGKGKVAKVHNVKSSFQLAQGQAHVGSVAIREPVAEATRPLPVVEGKGKAITTNELVAQSLLALHIPKRRSTTDQFIFQRRTPATKEASIGPSAQPQDDTSANIVHDSPSPADAETGADTDRTNSGGDTEILQFGDEQGDDVTEEVNLEDKTAEIDEGQVGSDPAKTPESRRLPDDNKMDENQAGPDPGESPVARVGPDPEPTDQFFNDKSTEDEPGKLNVEVEVVSMVTIPIYQASSSVPPIITDSELAARVTTLEQKFAAFEQKSKTLDNTTQNLGSRAPLRDRFRDLPEADMKEMLHQRMFESGSYKSLLEHVALYEALEASMERAQRDKFFPEWDKSRKRRRDDQDPPPTPDSDLNKKKRHDSGASGSS
ncbi:hypothetical protein Tco_0656775 [Tanacetum coccineum]|uniref:Histone deacetylase 14 n=1 Tax=Tanacetum coccineum TaxID=301880 RepID=A0ABQ4X9P8_9ASTR